MSLQPIFGRQAVRTMNLMTSLYFAENKNCYFWRQICQGKISSKQLFLEVLLIVVKTQGKQYLGSQPQLRTGTIWLSMAGPQVIPIANACKCLSNGIMGQAWEMSQHSQTPSFSPKFTQLSQHSPPRNISKPESHSHELPHLCAIMFLRPAFHLLVDTTVDHIISCVPKCNKKKLEKGPTRKTKNLFARLSLQFACQDLWPLRRCWEKCWVVGRNIDCSIMRDRFEQTS